MSVQQGVERNSGFKNGALDTKEPRNIATNICFFSFTNPYDLEVLREFGCELLREFDCELWRDRCPSASAALASADISEETANDEDEDEAKEEEEEEDGVADAIGGNCCCCCCC